MGLKALEHHDFEAARASFASASNLDPNHREYFAAQEFARQEIEKALLAQADRQLAGGRPQGAQDALNNASQLDGEDPLLKERLQEVLADRASPSIVLDSPLDVEPEVQLQPTPGMQALSVRGNTRATYEQIARAFGLTALFDTSISTSQLRFDIDKIGFAEAIALVEQMSKTFLVPLSAKQFLVVGDTAENRRQFERVALETFRISEETTPQELNDFANLFRNVFEVRLLAVDQASGTITVRATHPVLEAINSMVAGLNQGKPEVRLNVEIFDVAHSFMRQIGVTLPTQFSLFNVQSEARTLLGSANLSQLGSLLSSGSLTAAGAAAVAALLAGSQGSGASSLISQPFAVFGGGLTQSALVIPATSLAFSQTESWLKTLNNVSIIATQDTAATFRAGSRYPIETAAFSVPSISALPTATSTGNLSIQNTVVPSFTYEDLGLTVKATPTIHADREVTIKIELQVRALGAQTINNVPVISNREYQGTVTCKEGETAILLGYLTQNESRAAAGLPWISSLPVLGRLTSNGTKENDQDQLLVVITPNLVRGSFRTSTETWIPR